MHIISETKHYKQCTRTHYTQHSINIFYCLMKSLVQNSTKQNKYHRKLKMLYTF